MPKSVRMFSLFLVNDARLRSNFTNSYFVFHRGFQTLENNKSTRPTASCFHQFSRVWKPRWNTRTRFWNITSKEATKYFQPDNNEVEKLWRIRFFTNKKLRGKILRTRKHWCQHHDKCNAMQRSLKILGTRIEMVPFTLEQPVSHAR